ncbi:MAG: lantibiotic dehydratase [Kofleriaceae bacterium]
MRSPSSFAAAGFFAFRSPLLPLDDFVAWSRDLSAADAPDLDAAIAADRSILRARLRAVIARPEVREALFLASPSLDESVAFWEAKPDDERGLKVERTLTRYFARMTGRCTPFGLFAGCSKGAIGERTRFVIGERSTYRRQTRLDMDYVFSLCEALAAEPALRETLVYRPSSSLYRAAGQLRYAEARLADKQREYNLVGIEPTDYLIATLTRATGGARASELIDALVDPEAGIDRDDAAAFVTELVDAQVLVPELHPAVTGAQALDGLIGELAVHPADAARIAHELLVEVRAWLAAHDASPLGVEPARYRAVAERLAGLPVAIDLARLFQVDTVKPAPALELGRDVVDEVARVVTLLHGIAPPRREDALDRFRDAFVRRYEDREVPLGEALDEEAGIGFDTSTAPSADASPLLAGFQFPAVADNPRVAVTARSLLALAKLEQAIATGAREVVLTPEELAPLANPTPPPLPDSFSMIVSLAAASEAALAAGDYRIGWVGISGPSGANLLGRFCHGDPALAADVAAYLQAEEALRPAAVYAEIVHLPEGRLGNLLARPALRAYEIPYLGRSGVPADHQISVEDLMVSVRDGAIVLRSRRLDREVIPRMTTAHNFHNPRNLGVYRFLCAFQAHDTASLGWSWGVLERARFLPRVVVGRCVLAQATWRLEGPQLAALGKLRGAALVLAIRELRRDRGLPRYVEVADGDNTLPIDLDNILAIETFVQLVKARSEVVLQEVFPGHAEACASGPEGRFAHELVIPFTRTAAPKRSSHAARAPVGPRSFAPGTEWLYLRLYGGSGSIDHVLRSVAPAIEELRAAGAFDRWFFIRYSDPAWHLRLRFHGAPERLLGEVVPALERATRALLADGRIYRSELGTYDRELERYGGADGIALAEELFSIDSDAVLAIVQLLEGDAGAEARWRLALRGMDQLLDDLGFSPADKLAVAKLNRAGFGEEFSVGVGLERQLGDRFRSTRKSLEALLDPANDAASDLAPALAVLAERSRKLAPVAAALRDANLDIPLPILAGNYLHMYANRLLRGAHRAHELILHDLLVRLYEGRAARARRAGGGLGP